MSLFKLLAVDLSTGKLHAVSPVPERETVEHSNINGGEVTFSEPDQETLSSDVQVTIKASDNVLPEAVVLWSVMVTDGGDVLLSYTGTGSPTDHVITSTDDVRFNTAKYTIVGVYDTSALNIAFNISVDLST